MLQALQRRLAGQREEGFTLIELMVVVLIIAILIAIAIPTFLGARQRAQNRAAQSNVRNAFTAEKTFYTDKQAYSSTGSELTSIEPSLAYSVSNVAPATVGTVYVNVTAGGVLQLGVKAASGNCYYLQDTPTGATAGTMYAQDSTCAATLTGATYNQSSWT